MRGTAELGRSVRVGAPAAVRVPDPPPAMAAAATTQFTDHPDPLQTRRIAAEWLRHLPPLDVVGRQEHVVRAFEGMRHACAPADLDRAAAIEYVDAMLEVDHRRLVKWHLENLDGPPGLADRFWRLANEVNRGFAFAYHALLESAQASGRDRRWQQRLPLLIARLVHFHGIDARLRLLRGERWAPAKWAQLHRLLLEAADAGIERVPTAWESADPLSPRSTVEQEYLHVLLVQQLDTGNLSPAEIDWVGRELRGWGRDLALEPAPAGPDGFYVDLSGTTGLLRRSGNDRGARVGYVDTAPLVRRIDAAIDALHDGVAGPGLPPARRQRVATLAKIRPSFAPRRDADLRRHPRVPVDVEAAVRVGLGRIAGGLAGDDTGGAHAAGAPGAGGEAWRGRPRIESAPPAAAEPSAVRPGAEAPGEVEEIEIPAVTVASPADGGADAVPVASSAEPRHPAVLADPGWRIKDRSLGGLRLVGGSTGERPRIGALVAVRSADLDDWLVGVVRRVRKADGGAVELGVALIVERALPVTLRSRRPAQDDLAFDLVGAGAADGAGRFDGLYLIPPAPPDERPALRTVIIPTAEHFEGRNLCLSTPRSNYAVTLRELVDQHGDWSRVTIQVSARAQRGASA